MLLAAISILYILASVCDANWSEIVKFFEDPEQETPTAFHKEWTVSEEGYWVTGFSYGWYSDKDDAHFRWHFGRPLNALNTESQSTVTLDTTEFYNGNSPSRNNRICPSNYAIYSVKSTYHGTSWIYDRLFTITCKQLPPQYTLDSCKWIPDDTNLNENIGDGRSFNYECGNKPYGANPAVLRGIYSNYYNDYRFFRFQCCDIRYTPIDIVPEYDNSRVLVQIESIFNTDDRIRNLKMTGFGKPKWYIQNSGNPVTSFYPLMKTLPDDDSFTRICPKNGAFSSIIQTDNNTFSFECAQFVNDVIMDNCKWTDYLNQFHTTFSGIDGLCPKDGGIRGIQMYYSMRSEDYKIKIHCCEFKRNETFDSNLPINIKATTHSDSDSGSSGIITFDLCWNGDLYQGIKILNSNDETFVVDDITKHDSCGNERFITISTDSIDNLRIESIGVTDVNIDYVIESFYDHTSISNNSQLNTTVDYFVLDKNDESVTNLIIKFPHDYLLECTDADGCVGDLYDLDYFQQYLITFTQCASFIQSKQVTKTTIGECRYSDGSKAPDQEIDEIQLFDLTIDECESKLIGKYFSDHKYVSAQYDEEQEICLLLKQYGYTGNGESQIKCITMISDDDNDDIDNAVEITRTDGQCRNPDGSRDSDHSKNIKLFSGKTRSQCQKKLKEWYNKDHNYVWAEHKDGKGRNRRCWIGYSNLHYTGNGRSPFKCYKLTSEQNTDDDDVVRQYELIVNQKDAHVALFSSAARSSYLENENDITADTFMNIGNLNPADYADHAGYYMFKLIYTYDDDSTDTLEWKQTSWLTASTITGYVAISVPQDNDLLNPQKFLGLARSTWTNSVLDGHGQLYTESYWGSVGTIQLSGKDGIAAINNKQAKGAALYISFSYKMHSDIDIDRSNGDCRFPDGTKADYHDKNVVTFSGLSRNQCEEKLIAKHFENRRYVNAEYSGDNRGICSINTFLDYVGNGKSRSICIKIGFKTDVGVVLRGLKGNLDKEILSGPLFGEELAGIGNIGDVFHIDIEHEGGADYCIESATLYDPFNGAQEFGRDYFSDGIILSKSCENDPDFRLLSGNKYVRCYDRPFSIVTYASSLYTSIQMHACDGDKGGIAAVNSTKLSLTVTGKAGEDKFVQSDALSLQSSDPWNSGESREYTLQLSGAMTEVSLITITNNHETDYLCVDSVLINGEDAFLKEYWVGLKNTADGDDSGVKQTIPAVLKWPICNMELTTTISARSPLPTDPDAVATSTCVNRNRLVSVDCEISQSFETFEEISWEQEIGQEITNEITMEKGMTTEVSTSLTISGGKKWGKGTETSVGFEVSGGFGREWSSSKSRTEGTTKIDITTDGRVNGETISIECSGSVSVPPSQKIEYSLMLDRATASLTTLTDIKMTKCSKYLYNKDENDPNDYIYIYGIEGELTETAATNCYVEFGQAVQVNPAGITCGQERALATREWGVFVPQCDPNDPSYYQPCQCAMGEGTNWNQKTCGCVDTLSGNLMETAEASVVSETEEYGWRDWCQNHCGVLGINGSVIFEVESAKSPPSNIERDVMDEDVLVDLIDEKISYNNKKVMDTISERNEKEKFPEYNFNNLGLIAVIGLFMVIAIGILIYGINSCISCYDKYTSNASINKYHQAFDSETEIDKV